MMVTQMEMRRLKLERPVIVFFYRRLARWIGQYNFLLLTTIGRKSGQARTVPLVYMPVEDGYLVAAANVGSDAPPAWYLNLKAQPPAQIQIGRQKMDVIAEEAANRDVLWSRWLLANPGYAGFQAKTMRIIPLMLLRRVEK